MTQKTEALKRISQFVKGLEGTVREVTLKAICVPNSSDCQPEVLSLLRRYGNAYIKSTDDIESLRQELGANYDWLQFQLKRELHELAVTEGCVRVAEKNDYSNWKYVPKSPVGELRRL